MKLYGIVIIDDLIIFIFKLVPLLLQQRGFEFRNIHDYFWCPNATENNKLRTITEQTRHAEHADVT